jgi:hypothetical protein
MGLKKNSFRVLVEKPKKRPLERPRGRWQDYTLKGVRLI